MEKSELIHLPIISCSFAAEVHPNAACLEQQCDLFLMDALGVEDPAEREQFRKLRISLYIPMVIPNSLEDERMILACQHSTAFFVLDDILESGAHGKSPEQIKTTVMQVAQGTHDAASLRSEASQAALWIHLEGTMSKMRRQMHPPLFQRYLRCLSEFMDATSEELSCRKARSVLDEDQYRKLRRVTSYMTGAVCIFIEFVMGICLPQATVESPLFIDFMNANLDHVGLVNDVLSFKKDVGQGCSQNWLLVLLAHREDIRTLQQAVDCTYRMIQEEDVKVVKLQNELLEVAAANGDKDLETVATLYPLMCSGNVAWSYVTARYTGSDEGVPRPQTWKIERTQAQWEQECSHSHNVLPQTTTPW